jgi:hypothetical protein
MPRLSLTFPECVFFLYGLDPETGEIAGPFGSGVFVGVHSDAAPVVWSYYAITCAHVAYDGASIIRLNTTNGGSRLLEFEPHEWISINDGYDLAAVDVTDHIGQLEEQADEVWAVPSLMFASQSFMSGHEIGIGEDGFMLGLFDKIPGDKRNVVAARFGNISLIANADAKIEQSNGVTVPCHLFDIHSRPGFSGSPVFIYRTPSGDLRDANASWSLREAQARFYRFGGGQLSYRDAFSGFDAEQNQFVRLLGLHLGQYSETLEVKKGEPRREKLEPIIEGDKLQIASSMTVVAPVWGIETLLDYKNFAEDRDKRYYAAKKRLEEKPEE